MKSFLVILVLASLCVSSIAHGGRVSIYSDPGLTECILADIAPSLVNVYVAESSVDGATGLRFRIAESAGFTGAWLNESTPYLSVGNTRTDFSVGFGQCMIGKFLVLVMTYQTFGTSTCSTLSIEAVQGFPEPLCSWCVFHELPCDGFDPLYVNCSGPLD